MLARTHSNLAGDRSLKPEESTPLTSNTREVQSDSPSITTGFEQENTLFDANALTYAEDAEFGEGKGLSRLQLNSAITPLSVPAKVNKILGECLMTVVFDSGLADDDDVSLLLFIAYLS